MSDLEPYRPPDDGGEPVEGKVVCYGPRQDYAPGTLAHAVQEIAYAAADALAGLVEAMTRTIELIGPIIEEHRELVEITDRALTEQADPAEPWRPWKDPTP